MGAEQIIAVELNTELTHSSFNNRPNITIISPSSDIGEFMNFDRKMLDYRIKLGYYDTLKTFGKYHGFKYIFRHSQINHDLIFSFYLNILRKESDLNRKYIRKMISNNEVTPITSYLLNRTNKANLELDDYYYLGLEVLMELFDYDILIIYSAIRVINDINHQFLDEFVNSEIDFEKQVSKKPINILKKKIQGVDSFVFISSI